MKSLIVRIDDEKKKAFHSLVVQENLTMFSVLEGAIDFFLSNHGQRPALILYAQEALKKRTADDRRR